jgi:hypothetical protein
MKLILRIVLVLLIIGVCRSLLMTAARHEMYLVHQISARDIMNIPTKEEPLMISATTTTFGSDIGTDNLAKHVNVVFDNGPKMVSLSLNNSCGAMSTLARADIRLLFSDPLKGGCDDVTSTIFGGESHDIVRGTIENMEKAMNWLRIARWGFAL